ncbi:aminotransferase class I/II-fold pyridoxal phosphate-dependent enzyme [Streptomyces sp. L7]
MFEASTLAGLTPQERAALESTLPPRPPDRPHGNSRPDLAPDRLPSPPSSTERCSTRRWGWGYGRVCWAGWRRAGVKGELDFPGLPASRPSGRRFARHRGGALPGGGVAAPPPAAARRLAQSRYRGEPARPGSAHRAAPLTLTATRHPLRAPPRHPGAARAHLARHLTAPGERPVDPEDLVVVAGATAALDVVATALCDPGGEAIVVPTPCYGAFDTDLGGRSGARLLPAPPDPDDGHGLLRTRRRPDPRRGPPRRRGRTGGGAGVPGQPDR